MDPATRASDASPTFPPGWHADPWGEASLRWWDGNEWTGFTHVDVEVSPAETDATPPNWLAPVGRSGWAIAAGYLGLVSVLVAFAPFALFAGVRALRDIDDNPELLGRGRAWFGLLMGGAFTALAVAFAVGSALHRS